jgi:hypothetical protein
MSRDATRSTHISGFYLEIVRAANSRRQPAADTQAKTDHATWSETISELLPASRRNWPIRSALGSSFSIDRKPLPLIPPAFGPGSLEMLNVSASTPPQFGGMYDCPVRAFPLA